MASIDRPLRLTKDGKLLLAQDGKLADPACCCGIDDCQATFAGQEPVPAPSGVPNLFSLSVSVSYSNGGTLVTGTISSSGAVDTSDDWFGFAPVDVSILTF